MKKFFGKILCFLTLLLIAGCAAPAAGHIEPGKISRIQIGMTKDQVISAIGPPESSAADKNSETLYYVEERPWWQWVTIPVKLENGKVVSFGQLGR